MTKTIFTISGALVLAIAIPNQTPSNSNLIPVETNNLIVPIEVTGETKSNTEVVHYSHSRPTECPRNYPLGSFTTTQIESDQSSPQHCLESNCGLGVYVLRDDEVHQRCSYCNSVRPKDL